MAPALAAWPEAPPTVTGRQERLLRIFGPILLNPSEDIDPDTRRAAATELMALGVDDAFDVLDTALRSGQPAVVGAVIDAMAEQVDPAPTLLEPAVAALGTAPDALLDQLSFVLARYGEPALTRVATLALDREAVLDARLGAIHALGAFRSREGAGRLVSILVPARDEPEEIVSAACASLERLSGFPYGNDPAEWQRWWRDARDLPPEEWFRSMVQTLTARISELDQEIARQRDANARMARLLSEVYDDLYPALSVNEQLERLPALLDHELVPVRQFAVGRVARLLRDSVRIPEDVRTGLVARLADADPAIRREVAVLLGELDHPGLAEVVSAALPDEPDAAVVGTYLDILEKRPTATAFAAICGRIGPGGTGDRAADALWALFRADALDRTRRGVARSSVESALGDATTPALVRLAAFLAEDDAADEIAARLDSEDPALRAAVAEGFAAAGRLGPLLEHASDETIYPFAADALARGPATLARMEQLVTLAPPARVRRSWTAAVLRLAAQLDADDLVETEQLLAAAPHGDARIRRDVLQLAVDLPADQLATDRRIEAIGRLGQLLLDLDEANRAHELLAGLNGVDADSPIRRLRFRAAVLAGRFDAAAAMEPDAATWVELLAELATARPAAAPALRAEIERRFAAGLSEETRAAYDAACLILDAGSSAATGTDDAPG
ncbi:MAG: hypothetical protein ACYTG1_08060 [Planctomycetota bacterium]|jgi:hypothetical protein